MSARLDTSTSVAEKRSPRAAEFFAGIGLVRQALEEAGAEVVFANDIEGFKRDVYAANFDASHFVLDDVRNIAGADIGEVELATASFPCTDLSLAGNRRGLEGDQSGMFWEFARVLREMGDRRPPAVLLENVPSFATSKKGEDLRAAIAELNDLGYACDLLVINARHFVPQSRPRLFIVGSQQRLAEPAEWDVSEIRPAWIKRFAAAHRELDLQAFDLRLPPRRVTRLAEAVERLRPHDPRWWEQTRVDRFVASLAPIQRSRLEGLMRSRILTWATAYRRTRGGHAVWEIRADEISGCLRTARGGSSKQAIVQAARGQLRIRWMTPLEYANLQGAPGFKLGSVTPLQALFGLGDAVCVPVVAWITEAYLLPLLRGELGRKHSDLAAAVAG